MRYIKVCYSIRLRSPYEMVAEWSRYGRDMVAEGTATSVGQVSSECRASVGRVSSECRCLRWVKS